MGFFILNWKLVFVLKGEGFLEIIWLDAVGLWAIGKR